MAWPTPQYSKGQVNRAGEILASQDPDYGDLYWAHGVLANWRACHGYPVNTFQVTLRNKLRRLSLGDDSIVAQRLKRTPSIIAKLRRFDRMQLARMQDIGGLRAIVPNLDHVRRLQADYKQRTSNFRHEPVSEKDYIACPKPDGYRSVHLVFRYKSGTAPEYDGLSVELQIRTKLQHTWATAVETMGTFLGQALKAREGPEQWLRFFEVTGSAFAYLEKSPQVPGYEKLSKWDTFARVQAAERELAALDKLSAFTAAVDPITEPGKKGVYHLIVLDSSQRPIRVHIRPYAKTHLRQAVNDYAETEKRASNGELIEAVLVAAGPVAEMRKAYPNYFLDTNDFVIQVRNIIEAITKRRGTIGEFWDSAEYLQTAASFIHSVLGDR